ncbi:M3 family metallopeptidase [Bacillus spongiae]|uniref:M3 family metallopeptidase n=1 Tax=Bacillus spongiae TaxID=2683610 RepID=A0ABU8HC67_9BACI
MNFIKRKEGLTIDTVKPWDTKVESAQTVTIPYKNTSEMVDKAENLLHQLSPSFSTLLREMKELNHLDLESRKGKAPGGFCEFLPASKTSFILLNLVNTKDDLAIFLHEMGHGIHHDLMKELPLNQYKTLPKETAELAAMSIELLTLENWTSLYHNDGEYNQVKRELFKQILEFIPMTIVIDQFQHWLYTNPSHTHEDRNNAFLRIVETYESSEVNWEGLEEWKKNQWMDVIHLFETPFYYIEYAIAQLGALQLYRNYKEDPHSTIQQFIEALSLGSSKPVKEIYSIAGIDFTLSEEMMKDLMAFVMEEIKSTTVLSQNS